MTQLRRPALVAFVVAAALSAPRAQQAQPPPQQAPVFRAGVDLVTVDLLVVDKSGKLVTDLTAADFTVTAGRKARRIVSAEFVNVAVSTARNATSGPGIEPAPAATTNLRPLPGRSIIFVVDIDEIRAGEGRLAIKGISDYMDRLKPFDRVGLVSLPNGTPRVDLTTNRKLIRDAAGTIAGGSVRGRGDEMTPGEANQIRQHDDKALLAYFQRIRTDRQTAQCGLPVSGKIPLGDVGDVSEACVLAAERTLDAYRPHVRAILDSLGALAKAMTPIEGPKALVLVSEGLMIDTLTLDDLKVFSQAAERARVTLYALHLDAPLTEASSNSGLTTASRLLDDHAGFDGMTDLALSARGNALRVVGASTNALQQIDTELSGYYLLSFERSIDDKDGARVGIDVKVNRPGVDIRARKEFTPGPPPKPVPVNAKTPAEIKTAMGELLRWPVPIAEIGVDVDTFAMPVDGSAKDVRTIIAAELGMGARPLTVVGFEVIDDQGKVVADAFDQPPAAQPLPDGRWLYPVAVLVPPGHYRLKIGAIDADGRRGSVEHGFDVQAWAPGAPRLSDMIFGAVDAGKFRPIARVVPGSATLPVRLEVQADAAAAFSGAQLKIRITRAGESTALTETAVTIAESGNPLKRSAFRALDIGDLPPGDYVVRATLETPGAASVVRMRAFQKR